MDKLTDVNSDIREDPQMCGQPILLKRQFITKFLSARSKDIFEEFTLYTIMLFSIICEHH